MRLWTLHPRYLDSKGLVALWRESLLAQAVLYDKTKGYKAHPQLVRFRECKENLNPYLHAICDEADARGYAFDRAKIKEVQENLEKIKVKRGQVLYEWEHLLKKLEIRDPERFEKYRNQKGAPDVFSVFEITPFDRIEPWEKT